MKELLQRYWVTLCFTMPIMEAAFLTVYNYCQQNQWEYIWSLVHLLPVFLSTWLWRDGSLRFAFTLFKFVTRNTEANLLFLRVDVEQPSPHHVFIFSYIALTSGMNQTWEPTALQLVDNVFHLLLLQYTIQHCLPEVCTRWSKTWIDFCHKGDLQQQPEDACAIQMIWSVNWESSPILIKFSSFETRKKAFKNKDCTS